jgi:hypothetical protein
MKFPLLRLLLLIVDGEMLGYSSRRTSPQTESGSRLVELLMHRGNVLLVFGLHKNCDTIQFGDRFCTEQLSQQHFDIFSNGLVEDQVDEGWGSWRLKNYFLLIS